MGRIRELFHKVGNCHNKISVGAGVTKAELRQKFKGGHCINPEDIEKIINRLSELEKHAVEASRVLNQLKDIIYGIVEPDTGKPKQ